MCMLFRFLGRYSCRTLQTNWNTVLRDSLELLASEHDEKLKNVSKIFNIELMSSNLLKYVCIHKCNSF